MNRKEERVNRKEGIREKGPRLNSLCSFLEKFNGAPMTGSTLRFDKQRSEVGGEELGFRIKE